MGTYTRPNKAYGGNSYRDGDKLPAAELNADFDNLVTLANGNLDSDNISSSANIPGTAIASAADIDPSKIGDYSANSGEMKTVTSPGDSASPSLATTLEEEIARLRYGIRGTKPAQVGAQYMDAGVLTTASWTEPPIVGPNLLRNGGFNDQSVTSGDPPAEWIETNSLGATSIAGPDSNYIAYGVDKKYYQFTTSSGVTIAQTVKGLRANTKYLVGCAYSLTAAGTLFFATANAVGTGATDYTDFSYGDSSAAATSVETFNGIIKTDGSATDIVVAFTTGSGVTTARLLNVWFYELNDAIPTVVESIPTQTATANSEVTNLPSTVASGTNWATNWTDISTLALSQYIPNPGYRLIYEVKISWASALDDEAYFYGFRLEMNDGSDSYPDGPHIQAFDNHAADIGQAAGTVTLTHTVDNAVPGATYVFTPQVTAADSAADPLAAPRLHPLITVTAEGSASAGSNGTIQTVSKARLRVEKL